MFWCKCEKRFEDLQQVYTSELAGFWKDLKMFDNRFEGLKADLQQRIDVSYNNLASLENGIDMLHTKFKDFEKACQTMISREQNLLQTLSEKVAKLEKASRMYVRKKGRPYRLLINKESNE